MKKRENWLYRVCEGLCVLLSISFALLRCYSNSPLFLDLGTDSPIFLTVGKAITLGKVPYVDIVENKGPLLFLLNGLPQYLMPGATGAFILEMLMSVGACLMILRMARYLQKGRLHIACALIPVTLYYSAISLHLSGGNYCEEYDVFLTVAAMAILLRSFYGKPKNTLWHAFGLGVLMMAVMLIKISDILGVGVTVLFYIAYVLREKKNFWKEAGAFIGGLAVVAAPIFAYLLATNSVGAMLQEYILSNFSHVSGAEDAGFFAQRVNMLFSGSDYARYSLQPVWLALIAAVVGVILLKICSRNQPKESYTGWLLAYSVALAVAVMAGTYVSTTGYGQHLIPIGAPIMLSGLILTVMLQRLMENRQLRGVTQAAAVGVAALLAWNGNLFLVERSLVSSEEYRQSIETYQEFQEEIWADRDSVFCVNMPRKWYYINDVMPAYKYMNLVSYIQNGVGENCAEAFEEFIMTNDIQFLVFQWEPEDYRGILTDATLDYIAESYVLDMAGSDSDFNLYVRW
ncbi:MAG: hypothetical protein PHI98_04795 [Eubacteriales bacterium]|nr:hypothetical protein [Eubacteriales bacterium]